MSRPNYEFSDAVKDAAWESAKHRCEGDDCGRELTRATVEFHHIVGVALCYEFRRTIPVNWARSIDNIKVLCHGCHTREDKEMSSDWLSYFREITGTYITYSQIAGII